MKYWTGIGSRETPKNLKGLMNDIAASLSEKGFCLRSGGAKGADTFFESGAGDKEIYLPWKGFEGNKSELYWGNLPNQDKAEMIAKRIHPAWDNLKQGGRKMHARNIFQVIGADFKTLSKFVICWTQNGEEKGGTRTAIVYAKSKGIRVLNLAKTEDLKEVREKLKI